MTVVGVTGHQRLPATLLPIIAEEVRRHLAMTTPPLVGITSLAVGADQLFAEIVEELRGELHVIVPSHDYERTFDPAGLSKFWTLCRAASSVDTLGFESASEDSFLAAGQRIVERADEIVAIWDGKPARGVGGTADIVAYARARGVPVIVIWPNLSGVQGRA